jgi:hypothetical protein
MHWRRSSQPGLTLQTHKRKITRWLKGEKPKIDKLNDQEYIPAMEKETHDPIQEKPSFLRLAHEFDKATLFLSSPDGIKADPSFQAIVEMGEPAIPEIIWRFKAKHNREAFNGEPTMTNHSPMLLLAINEIAGGEKDVVGFVQTQANPQAMLAKAEQWAEDNSHIAIRDQKILRGAASVFLDTTEDNIKLTAGDQLVDRMFRPDRDLHVDRFGNSTIHGKIEVNGRELSIEHAIEPDPYFGRRALVIIDETLPKAGVEKLPAVTLILDSHYVTIMVGNDYNKRNTREAVRKAMDTLNQMFGKSELPQAA